MFTMESMPAIPWSRGGRRSLLVEPLRSCEKSDGRKAISDRIAVAKACQPLLNGEAGGLEIFDQRHDWVDVDRFGCRNVGALVC